MNMWIVFRIRVPFRVLFIRLPFLQERDPDLIQRTTHMDPLKNSRALIWALYGHFSEVGSLFGP